MANWKGTAIPTTGNLDLNSLYLNTAMSVEEVVSVLEKIQLYDFDGTSSYAFCFLKWNDSTEGVTFRIVTTSNPEDTSQKIWAIYLIYMFNMIPIFSSIAIEESGLAEGWQMVDGVLVIDAYMNEIKTIQTDNGGSTILPFVEDCEEQYRNVSNNELLSSLFSITPFTQEEEPVLNLSEFLTGIADAIREVKGTTEKINAQNYKPEILKFKELIGSGGGLVEPITITKNGVYNSFYKTEEVTINQDTEFDFEVEGMLFKKVPQLSIPEDADIINNNEKYTLYGIGKSGGATIIEMSKTLGELKYTYDQTYGVGMLSDPTAQLSVLWVKDPAYSNTSFGSDVFESNTVYVTNFLAIAIASEYGVTFDEWEITLNAPGNKELNGVSPINVDTRSGLAIEFENFPSDNDTIPYALYCRKRYKGVSICYEGKVSDISLLMPCYGISAVDTIPTENMFYTTKKGEYYNMYYYFLKSDKQVYVFFKDGENVTQLSGAEFATTFFGEELPYKGEVFIKDVYNITTDGYFVVYEYDYYIPTYSIVNGELTKNWTPVNNNNIRSFQRVSSTNGITYKTGLGKHIYGSVSYFWFVNKTPISGVYTSAGESDDGTLTCTLSSQTIFNSFGSGTFEITLIVRSTDSVCRFEDSVLNTTITIDENGNSV